MKKPKPPQLDKSFSRHRSLTKEEHDLWRAAMGDALQMPAPAPVIAKPVTPKPVKLKKAPLAPIKLEKITRTQLTRGKIKVEATLDLHGFTRDTAYTALVAKLEHWQERGVRLALVITGKGKGGKGGILQELLPRWLNESPLRERIIAYDRAPARHGGQGAWVIRIRKNNAR